MDFHSKEGCSDPEEEGFRVVELGGWTLGTEAKDFVPVLMSGAETTNGGIAS